MGFCLLQNYNSTFLIQLSKQVGPEYGLQHKRKPAWKFAASFSSLSGLVYYRPRKLLLLMRFFHRDHLLVRKLTTNLP
jgi:hypothetical protein